MEKEVKDFFWRIVWSVSLGFLWLVLTIGIGAYNELLVPEDGLSIGHIIFYIWALGSLVGLVWLQYKIWRKKFPHG